MPRGHRTDARFGIEAGFEIEDDGEVVAGLDVSLETEFRLAQTIRRHRRDGMVAVLADHIGQTRIHVLAEWRAVVLMGDADVDDTIEGDAVPGQAGVFGTHGGMRGEQGARGHDTRQRATKPGWTKAEAEAKHGNPLSERRPGVDSQAAGRPIPCRAYGAAGIRMTTG